VSGQATLLEGGCHCRKLRYVLEWPAGAGGIPARRCTCGYCSRFNGTWTSHPDARLRLRREPGATLECYRFGTRTADFLFCGACGVTIAALCETGGRLRAVVNVNTLDAAGDLEFERSDSDFEGETLEERLDRRAARWIGDVVVE
jgi:hypothetical protein